ncbi:Response regulator of citrate/malate metabolism [Arthrobacter alpinus]|uniref:Transcriptional regulatory protein n=1 Tax=Arthrobacter alpinus TaxID=656366 RepID=A0A1H5JKW4_9MICC|nr:response regulator [Arthrobacter alpinus]SEE53110.1 Response regulator of citrate/malate metabolism [Arthrobacter alpinus]
MTGPSPIRVLVVDDEPIALAAHADYVRRLDGFEVVAEAHGMGAALAVLNDPAVPSIQLILLDMNLTDGHGLDLLRRIHGLGLVPDVVAITAVRDVHVVRSAIALGITAYLIKPFTFAAFREKLENYRNYHVVLADRSQTSQDAIDRALSQLRPTGKLTLPKGMLPETLSAVADWLRTREYPASATEAAAQLAMSRVTARRYLDHLVETGSASKAPRHGSPGRPELEYSWSR